METRNKIRNALVQEWIALMGLAANLFIGWRPLLWASLTLLVWGWIHAIRFSIKRSKEKVF